MKFMRFGQATPMTKMHFLKIRKCLTIASHVAFLDIAWYTAERPSAILQLQVEDVYSDSVRRSTAARITFRKNTRKMDDTRQTPISQELRAKLRSYKCPVAGWLIPSSIFEDKHLTLRAIDGAFRRAVRRAGLEDYGYSLYSLRRGALTELHRRGFTIREIQAFSGHKSLASLMRYLEVSEEQVEQMVEVL